MYNKQLSSNCLYGLLFKDVVKEKDYFLSLFFIIFLLLITNFSILENLTVEAQEDLEILVNEDEGISETDGDTSTDEGNNQQEKINQLN